MNLNRIGDVDYCEGLLRLPLTSPDEYTHREIDLVERTLQWYRGEGDEALSLIDWLTLCRVVGDDIAIQLDFGDETHYLQFDTERSRVVLINPEEGAEVPVEETDISDTFQDAAVDLCAAHNIGVKSYEAITAVTHPERDVKIVFGDIDGTFTHHTDDGNVVEYDAKTTFTLPRPMTPSEIHRWLDEDAGEDVLKVVQTNDARGWDSDTDSNGSS